MRCGVSISRDLWVTLPTLAALLPALTALLPIPPVLKRSRPTLAALYTRLSDCYITVT